MKTLVRLACHSRGCHCNPLKDIIRGLNVITFFQLFCSESSKRRRNKWNAQKKSNNLTLSLLVLVLLVITLSILFQGLSALFRLGQQKYEGKVIIVESGKNFDERNRHDPEVLLLFLTTVEYERRSWRSRIIF
jgi:hypothetical protein